MGLDLLILLVDTKWVFTKMYKKAVSKHIETYIYNSNQYVGQISLKRCVSRKMDFQNITPKMC